MGFLGFLGRLLFLLIGLGRLLFILLSLLGLKLGPVNRHLFLSGSLALLLCLGLLAFLLSLCRLRLRLSLVFDLLLLLLGFSFFLFSLLFGLFLLCLHLLGVGFLLLIKFALASFQEFV